MQIFILILYLSKSSKIFTITLMVRNLKFLTFFMGLIFFPGAFAATSPSNYVSANTYNNMYPYMNNTMRTNLNPGTNQSQSNAQINVLTQTKNLGSTTRSVVPRTNARVATITTSGKTGNGTSTAARTATNNATNTARIASSTSNNTTTARAATTSNNTASRRVVARSGTSTVTMQPATSRTVRGDVSTHANRTASSATISETDEAPLSSSRCMADYIECMNSYCERENTAYDRCYCSSKLAQIDAQYQPEIDRLIKEIITLQGTNHWTDEEMNEYWKEMIGKYTGDNSWVNLENALNIAWAGTESRVRGQQAFATGHSYCVQHLKGCAYMASNMRDAYRSEIARDCATYETSLQKLKTVAESVVESYK